MAEVEAELQKERHTCGSLHNELQDTKLQLEEVRRARTQSEDENAELRQSMAQLRGDVASRSKELEAAELKVRGVAYSMGR